MWENKATSFITKQNINNGVKGRNQEVKDMWENGKIFTN